MAGETVDFEAFYKRWYLRAIRFALEYIRDESEAENIVQEVFVNMFDRRKSLSKDINLTYYLFSSVKNRCINYLNNKLRQRSVSMSGDEADLADRLSLLALEDFDVTVTAREDLETRLNEALSVLPPRCRQIFSMSKIEGKKQTDIAGELGVSINTVESQMKIAYIKLREELKDLVK
ncbi:MAG: RNA polymerase sigma-70 factor [Bacteroidales bacterium]|nr:RNA polymerase sigma-70 factor [Bacteroidales bacterium]